MSGEGAKPTGPLPAGSRLGPYEILSLVGAGAMGEVYRARDERLKRLVAIKVLPASFSSDPHRLRRFEQEAHAAGSLNHPNVTSLYDIGSHEGAPFIVSELLEGETLRSRLTRGALPARKAVEYATQIAQGLAAAHEKGIVHRDLKPENLFVTKDGVVKILDFGLAKLTRAEEGSGDEPSLPTVVTETGAVLGTLGYMSPEQVAGEAATQQSDIFSFGAVLYEMLIGARAFRGDSRAQILSAILRDDPPELSRIDPRVPSGLMRVVARCLEKEPRDRFESIRDVGYSLDAYSQSSEETGGARELPAPRLSRRWRLAVVFAGLAVLAGTYFLGERVQLARTSSPEFRQLTFRGAGISSARFTPDGQSVVFSSETEGRPSELFTMRLDSPEVRPLGLPPAHILSISSTGEMAILLLRPFAVLPRVGHIGMEQIHRDMSLFAGTLAEAPISGGAPRELLEDVGSADWAPEGANLAVTHRVGNRDRLEFPIGKVIYDDELTALHNVRVSRDGQVAFQDWASLLLKSGESPARPVIAPVIESAWFEPTGEIWYGRGTGGIGAVTPKGRERQVATPPSDFVLYDISSDGRLLLGRLAETTSIRCSFPGESRDRDLSYFNGSEACDVSASGDELLFLDRTRNGEGALYLRRTDGSPPKRLADLRDVFEQARFSPDRNIVLSGEREVLECRHVLRPTGPGQTRRVSTQGVAFVDNERDRSGLFPHGKSVFFTGVGDDRSRRIWRQDLAGGKPRPITPENTTRPVLMGGGQFLCARGPDFKWHLYSAEGKGEPRDVAGILPGEEPIRSTPDGKWLYVRGADELKPGETLMTTRVYRLDPLTGQRELWKEIPSTPSRDGGAVTNILFSADGKICAWTHIRYSSELVLVSRLR